MFVAGLPGACSHCNHRLASRGVTYSAPSLQNLRSPSAQGHFLQGSLPSLRTWKPSIRRKVLKAPGYTSVASQDSVYSALLLLAGSAKPYSLKAVQGQQCRPSQLVRAAMFDDLSRNLDKAWDLVRKDGKLTKDNIKEPMREIRRALLEADVSKHMYPPAYLQLASRNAKLTIGCRCLCRLCANLLSRLRRLPWV